MTWAEVNLPNGTQIHHYCSGPGGVYPTQIIDAQGNYLTITYVNNQGPRIQTVTDTLGRLINFHYDAYNLLTAITAPGLNGGSARTLLRLKYHQMSLGFGFAWPQIQSSVVRDSYPWVLDAIYYPGTGTGFWFGDSDSYASYGMLAKTIEQRGMGFSASSLNEQGTVSQGQLTRKEVYNYPLTPNYSLTDAPTYTSCTETWSVDGTNFNSATTTYEIFEQANPRTVKVTMPNGTSTKQYSYNSPGSFLDGLVYLDETRNASSTVIQSSTSEWAQGAYESPRPTRVTATDDRPQTMSTEFSYGSYFNQVTDVRNFDYNGALLRSTRTVYENNSNYITSRRIRNLPLVVEVYAGDNITRVSRTEYQYDGQTLTDAPDVVQHADNHNPYAPQYWVEGECCQYDNEWGYCVYYCPGYWTSEYNPITDYRGNVTQITTYADAINLAGAITETRRYDITGNLVKSNSGCCEQKTFGYSLDTQFAFQQSETRGSATDPYAQITNGTSYDFNTGVTLSATDANGRPSQSSYLPDNLRLLTSSLPSGGHIDRAYDDLAMSITETGYLETHPTHTTIVNQNVKYMDGRGQERQEKALGAGGVWDFVDSLYDNMGRVSQQTLPYRTGDTKQWTTTTYDALSRVINVQTADGSNTQTFYNEATKPTVASASPGETTRVVDAWGRERWGRADAQGRLVEVVEPDPSGSGSVSSNGMVTTYTYNTLGNVTGVTQGSQTRSFKYDSLARLTAQKLAETSATLNDAGTYVGGGQWSDVFSYDARSNLTSRTDARGVKTVYTFNNDPLNRLQSVSWDTSGFGDSANPILSAATISYGYRQKDSPSQLRDVTQPSTVSTAGISTESYTYDSEGRVSSKTLTLTSRPYHPFVTDYIYDQLNRINDVRYPAEYGNGSQPRKIVHHDYDIASRLSGITVDGQAHASNIIYNAASHTQQLKVGASGANQITENYSYDAPTGLLQSQTVVRGSGTTLLNLGYDYAGPNSKRTGQLTKITNYVDQTRNRGYEYDALGRLKRATGGLNVNWAQRYDYDRYGNRQGVFSYTADAYVRNFYQSAFNRQPTSNELQAALGSLQTAYAQGPSQFLTAMQNLGNSLFTNQEYINRYRTNSEYVYDLYKAYLYREPDQVGWDFWTGQVASNGRDAVRAAFAGCLEFNLKVSGISPYSPPSGTVPRDGWEAMTYDQATNRVSSSGWNYDAAGNQTRAQNAGLVWQRFQFDAANRLVRVKADDNVTVRASHTYGATNERLMTEESGLRVYYAGDGGLVRAEYTESGASTTPAWSRSYVYLEARLLSTLAPNGSGGEVVQYHHPDRLGTRLVTNAQDTGSFEQVTLPFGTALANESTGATNRRFTSYDRSGTTSLDYAVNRFYDPQQGRFTQVDPIGMRSTSFESPQTLNLYAYCANDPINRLDPSGLGFFSFLKKIGKAILKVLKNKWVMLAIAIAIIVIAHYYPNALFSFGGGSASNAGRALPVLKMGGTSASALASSGAATGILTGTVVADVEAIITFSAAAELTQLAGVAALGTGGVAKALEGERLKDYEKHRAQARKTIKLKSCQDFLNSRGIDPQSLLKALNRQRPFDGLTSTLTMKNAGLLRAGAARAQMSVMDYFSAVNYGPDAATGVTRLARYNVYFGQWGIVPPTTLIHEALHSLLGGMPDWLLAEKLGFTLGNQPTSAINGWLATHGCYL
ncbi:MAG: RHS repeat-associated core domain-containing protein [Pyrinomonadaceae bacterium]